MLDFMDVELLKVVLSESGLLNKSFHFIWNLQHITDLSYHYKKNIADLLYYWQPAFGAIAFYNIAESMRISVDSFAAVVPAQLRVIKAENYQEAIHKVQAFNDGTVVPDNVELIDAFGDSEIKKRFLGALARISWLNLYEEPIAPPSQASPFYTFFKAIDSLRLDLLEKDNEQKKDAELLRKDFDNQITKMTIKMNAQAEMNKKTVIDFEQEIAALKSRLATQTTELARVTAAVAEKSSILNNLFDQITALEIDAPVKKIMSQACLSLIETRTIEKRLNIELTESDSVFLAKLQKKHPNLSHRELRISLLVKLNYDTVGIAHFIGISPRGMESIRYRLHKKMGLGKHQSIKTYLFDFALA